MSLFSWKSIFFETKELIGIQSVCDIIRDIIKEHGIDAIDTYGYTMRGYISGGHVLKEFLDIMFSNGMTIHYYMRDKNKTLNYLWPCITIDTIQKNLKGITYLIYKLLEADKNGIYALLRVSDIHHINDDVFLESHFDMNDMYLIEYTIMMFTFMVRLEIFEKDLDNNKRSIGLIFPAVQALEHHKKKRYQASLFTLMYFDLKRNKEF